MLKLNKMQITVIELIKKLEKFNEDDLVVIEQSDDNHVFSGALNVRAITLDYEHSDGSIEEENCVCISDE